MKRMFKSAPFRRLNGWVRECAGLACKVWRLRVEGLGKGRWAHDNKELRG